MSPSHSKYLEWWLTRKTRRHGTTNVQIDDLQLQVHNQVFNPDPFETWSTRLILDNLPNITGKRVLDLGTGTGVLALACARKGAAFVLGIDVAPNAVRNANENCTSLGLQRVARFLKGNLFDFEEAYQFREEAARFDLILANLPIMPLSSSPKPIQSLLIERVPDFLSETGLVAFTYADFGNQRKSVEESLRRSSLRWAPPKEVVNLGVRWSLFTGVVLHAPRQ